MLTQVVYLSDTAGYIPIAPGRGNGRPIAPSSSAYAEDPEAPWRPDLWDRDYNRRYRYNNTRVQRKWSKYPYFSFLK